MRTTEYHVGAAKKETLIAEYKRIKARTSPLSRKFRDMIVAKVEANKWHINL